jgi:phosphoglycolate phosphatase-like HAD superfamily hydrolase
MPSYLIIFDLDGTLISLEDASIDFDGMLVTAFQTVNVPIPSQAERDTLWRAGKDHAELLESWGVEDVRAFWDTFDELDFAVRSEAILNGHIAVYPDVFPALDRLLDGGEVLAVLTNTPDRLARFQLAHFGLDHGYFARVLALDIEGYDQTRAKPEPWGIEHIVASISEKMGLDFSGHVVLVGDSAIDMLAAKNAWVPGIQVLRDQSRAPSDDAFEAISSLDELDPKLIESVLRRFPECL